VGNVQMLDSFTRFCNLKKGGLCDPWAFTESEDAEVCVATEPGEGLGGEFITAAKEEGMEGTARWASRVAEERFHGCVSDGASTKANNYKLPTAVYNIVQRFFGYFRSL